jgi:hypothetical protein
MKMFGLMALTCVMCIGCVACGGSKPADVRINADMLKATQAGIIKTAPIGYATENNLANPATNVKMDGTKLEITVPANTTCVILNVAELFKGTEGILGANTTFTRSDANIAGKVGRVYDLVGSDSATKNNRVWRLHGSSTAGEGIDKANGLVYSHADFPAEAKVGLAIYRFNENRAEINFFANRHVTSNEPQFTGANHHFGHADAVNNFTVRIMGHDGLMYVLDVVVKVAA